jgi:hypothetical protein
LKILWMRIASVWRTINYRPTSTITIVFMCRLFTFQYICSIGPN